MWRMFRIPVRQILLLTSISGFVIALFAVYELNHPSDYGGDHRYHHVSSDHQTDNNIKITYDYETRLDISNDTSSSPTAATDTTTTTTITTTTAATDTTTTTTTITTQSTTTATAATDSTTANTTTATTTTTTTTTATTIPTAISHVSTTSSDQDDQDDVRGSSLKDWPDGVFCHNFMSNIFPLSSHVCGSDNHRRITCYGTPHDNKVGSCTMRGLAINIKAFYHDIHHKGYNIDNIKSIWLTPSNGQSLVCPKPDFTKLNSFIVQKDFVSSLAKSSALTLPQSALCTKWVNGTTFMFIGFDVHIYFKFLSWFSLFNGIVNEEMSSQTFPSLIVRLPETTNDFMFPEFERKLFHETQVVSLHDLSETNNIDDILCFEKVITTPSAFATNMFRCKMSETISRLRKKCYDCNSRQYPGSRFHQFRRRVLSACDLHDSHNRTIQDGIKTIVIQLRKPYTRFKGDSPYKFHRTFQNAQSFVDGVKGAFPHARVLSMVAEELSICRQVSMVHDADVLIGLHGAGLVHAWWLQDHAMLFELTPRSQISNPTFKMLTALTGRRYHSYTIKGNGDKSFSVDSTDVVNVLKREYFK